MAMTTIKNKKLMNDICRLCLKQGNSMLSLFDGIDEETQTSVLSEKITSMAHVEISPSDGLPISICHMCRWQVNQFHEFRLLVEMSDKALRTCFKPPLQDQPGVAAVFTKSQDLTKDENEFSMKDMLNYTLLVPTTEGLQVWRINEFDEGIDQVDDLNKLPLQESISTRKLGNVQKIEKPYKDTLQLQQSSDFRKLYMDDEMDDDETLLNDLNSITSCQLCYTDFSNLEDLKNHIAEHCLSSELNVNYLSPERENTVNNPQINVSPSSYETNKHAPESLSLAIPTSITKQGKPTLVQCNYCHKSLSTRSEKQHYEKCGLKNLQLICNDCDMKSAESGEFKYHKGTHRISPMICSTCNKDFRTLQSFKMHMKRHTLGSRYNCQSCDHSYYTNSELARHVQIHQAKRKFPCHLCETSFLSKPELNRHMKYHNGVKKFQCNICWKSYYESGHLKIHQKIHTGEKPFVCQLCQKAFVTKSKLARHSKIHLKVERSLFSDENS